MESTARSACTRNALVNPDFAALARAHGIPGATVRRTEEFEPAFEAALAEDGPALIELVLPADTVLPTATLSEIRETALAAG